MKLSQIRVRRDPGPADSLQIELKAVVKFMPLPRRNESVIRRYMKKKTLVTLALAASFGFGFVF